MRVFLDLLPGWPEGEVRALARSGWVPVCDERPQGVASMVMVRCPGPVPDALRAGDAALLDGEHLDVRVAACRARSVAPWVVARTPADVAAARALDAGVWLRGHEAGGAVPEFTGLVLIRAARGGPFVAEGLGERAMAAALAVGASGVVLGAHLWCTRHAPLHPAHRDALRGATSGRDTAVLGDAADHPFRVLARGAPEARRALAALEGAPAAFRAAAAAALEGWSARADALIPAPQCVGEAARLADHDAIDATRIVVEAARARRDALRAGHPLSAGRDPLGCGVPLVQGPMANVAEAPHLARAVAAAGAMPFGALGALDPGQATAVAQGFAAEVARPWGLGVIGFDVMPHRDAHLAIARETRPDAVILAGGSAELAIELQRDGLSPWLHTPSARLVTQALEKGVDAVVLEGREAGGHVGMLTSIGLWEEGLAAVEAGSARPLVVLAGGIGDPASAAFAAAMAAGAEARGARVALQAGTAFFFTHEIVASGQITEAYQQAALRAEYTTVVGGTVNLPLRCAPNAYVAQARASERAWLADGLPAAERRLRIEHANLGRTRIAAKGIEHDPAWGRGGAQRYRPVPTTRQHDEAAFTMGQGATVTRALHSVAEVVEALTADARAILDAPRLSARWGPVRPVPGAPTVAPVDERGPVRIAGSASARAADPAAPVAIVGVGCVLPGALDLGAFWDLLTHGACAIDDLGDARWSTDRYWDAAAGATGPIKTYSRLGGMIRGFRFDPLRYRIPPRVAATLDPAQRLALATSEQALLDAGWLDGGVDPERAAVVLGNSMGGEFAKDLTLRVRFREVLAALEEEGAWDALPDDARDALYARVEARLADALPPVDVDTMAGLLSNVVAGRVTAWLDWMGGNLTVDAACAASLAALCVAVDWLRSGRVDAVLTGGVDADLSVESYIGFARTLALSSAGSRPFAEGADGFVMGEGAAVFALKRLDDALSDGDPVWAVIRGIGQSSDGRGKGITAPRGEGQRLAIDRAYAQAGFSPASLGMVEAHGTGTSLGDRTEAGVLTAVLAGASTPTWLGSVKSNLGHLKGAAGAAGLLKATLAIATGIVPPTLSAGPARAELGLQDGPLRLPRRPTPFPDRGPRRASVSAFGFGGTNFHLLLEAAPASARRPAALDALIARAAPHVEHDVAAAAWPLPDEPEVAAAPPPALPRRAAESAPWWLVPGQGAQRTGAIAALREHPDGAAALDALARALPVAARQAGLSVASFEDLEGSTDTRCLHLLLYAVAVGWGAVLRAAGVPMAGAIGHSLGEYGALAVAGRLDPLDGLRLVAARGAALHASPPGAMLAVALPEPEAQRAAARHGLWVAAVNGPAATVLSGASDRVDAASAALRDAGVRATRLAVDRAFHTPRVDGAADALARALAEADFSDGPPVYSGATGRPFAADPRQDLLDGLRAPVRFADAIAHAAPSSAVELGQGRTLLGLARETAPTLVALDLPRRARPAASHASATPDDPVMQVVIAAIAEVTGYPADYLDPGADLEGDLGVDSIRKMEILGVLQDRLGFAARESDYADLASASPADLVAYVARRRAAAPTRAERPSAAPVLARRVVALPLHAAAPVTARVPVGVTRHDDLVVWRTEAASPRAAIAEGVALARAHPAFGRLVVVGPDTPAGAAAAGFGRSLARERDAAWRTITADGASEARIAQEALASDRPARVHLTADQLHAVALVPAGRGEHEDAVPREAVVLATGGTRGIVLPCLGALAPLRPRVLLLGRTPPDTADQQRLDALRARGIQLEWRACELTDADQVRAAAEHLRARHGRIDVVLHGAGALADGPTERVDEATIDAVLGPKLDGARHLHAATTLDRPALWIAFSSVVAHVGNPGQAVYAAANAALEALPHPTAARSLALAWTAWSEVGMASAPGVARLLAARGVHALTPGEGADAFRDALALDGVVAIAAEPPQAPPLPWPLTAITALTPGAYGELEVALRPESPFLADHKVGGRPLVPAAVWVAAILAAARCVDPREGGWSVADFTVHAPTFVESERVAIVRVEGPSVTVLLDDVVVASGHARPTPLPAARPPIALGSSRSAASLYRADVLFHGPTWQLLDQVTTNGNGEARAGLKALDGRDAGAASIDAAHQILAAWSGARTGWLGLPVGAGVWVLDPAPTHGPILVATRARVEGDAVIADVEATDAAGRTILHGSGVRLRRAARWPDDAPDTLEETR